MKRKLIAAAVLLLLLSVPAALSLAEEAPATQTDLTEGTAEQAMSLTSRRPCRMLKKVI